MSDSVKHPSIIFIDQSAGPLFRDLAEDISAEWSSGLLITGHPDTLKRGSRAESLNIVAAPEYKRTSYLSRFLSGIHYIIYVLFKCWGQPKSALLFSMSNPLCLGMVSYLFKRFRGQRYVIIIEDIYPDVLIKFGLLRETGLISRSWRRMNRLVWENAEIVFTIGEVMAATIEQMFDSGKTLAGKVVVVPNWADTDWIRPVAKDKNEFARRYGQVEKLTVMYSGNLGKTHDIETILAAAREMRKYDAIHFMIIGEGAKKKLVEKAKYQDGLDNLTVLPFQPEDILSASLPTADISIVTLDKGSENLSAPSKTSYFLAAGAALIGLCNSNSEVARMIGCHKCGVVVNPGDVDSLVSEILALFNDREKLHRYQVNSRCAAEEFYSRKNIGQYLDALSMIKY